MCARRRESIVVDVAHVLLPGEVEAPGFGPRLRLAGIESVRPGARVIIVDAAQVLLRGEVEVPG